MQKRKGTVAGGQVLELGGGAASGRACPGEGAEGCGNHGRTRHLPQGCEQYNICRADLLLWNPEALLEIGTARDAIVGKIILRDVHLHGREYPRL